MTFCTASDRLVFGQQEMGNKDGIIDPGMTFYASNLGKMEHLVGEPGMDPDNIKLLLVGKQLEPVEVGVTGEAHVIGKTHDLIDVVAASYRRNITVWVMTVPASKTVSQMLIMHTLPELFLDLLKMIVSKTLIPTVTIGTGRICFEDQTGRMRKFGKIVGMTIGTGEVMMYRAVENPP